MTGYILGLLQHATRVFRPKTVPSAGIDHFDLKWRSWAALDRYVSRNLGGAMHQG